MSVANQANEKLGQLVSLAAKIESHLSGGKTPAKGKGKGNTETAKGGGGNALGKDAAAIGSLSTSLATLIKEVDSMNPKSGDKLATFILKMSNAVEEAVKKGLDGDKVKQLNENLGALVKGSAGFMKEMAKSVLYGIPAMLGAVFFGATIRIVLSILKGVKGLDKEARESITAIVGLAKGALWFGLAMSAYVIIGIPAMLGAALFGLSVLIVSKVLAKVGSSKDAIEGVNSLMTIAKGAAMFALVMVGIGLLASQFALGALVFTLSVSAMLIVFNKLSKKSTEGVQSLMSIAKGAALFALTMVLIGLTAPQFAMGTLVFILAVSAMLIVFGLLSKTNVVTTGIEAVLNMAKGAAIFALAMVLIGLTAPLFALGTIAFILAASAMLLSFGALSAAFPEVEIGAQALNVIFKGALKFAIAMIVIGFFAQQFAIGALTFILASAAMLTVFGLLGAAFPEIEVGARALNDISKRIIPFTLALLVAGFFPKEVTFGALAVSGAMVLVGGAAAIVGMMMPEVEIGAQALKQLIAPMLAFTGALLILSFAGDPLDLLLKVGVVAAAIVVLGLAAAALGIPVVAPFVELGAGVLLTLGFALVVFSGALFILSQADFTKEKTDNLGYAIAEIGFALAKFGLMAIPAAIGAAVLIPASLALLPLAGALAIFKTIGWQKEDGIALQDALTSTVQGFAHALDGIGITGMFKALAAIPLIAMMGAALVSLAAGVKAMATLSFTEMEYDEKEKKLIPKRVVKLTDAEIQAVGPNTAAILNALAMPLVNFGMWASMGETGFGPFTIGAGYMDKGIAMASKIGGILTSLAKGVADMANLTIVDFEVVDPGTEKAKLVPKSSRKLTETDFTNAANNVSAILKGIAQPLVDFGKMTESGEGWFSDGYMQKGIDASAKVSGIVTGLADGVAKMANLEVTEYMVVNPGTKDAKLVPSNVRKLNPLDFALAAINVDLILKGIAKPLLDFGKMTETGEGWFSDGYLQKGIDAVAKIADPISKLADMVVKMAGGQATINEVVDDGKGGKKIVPKGVISFSDALPQAIESTKTLLNGMAQAMFDFGSFVDANEDNFEYAEDFIPRFSKMMKDISDSSEKFMNLAKNMAEAKDAREKSGIDPAKELLGSLTLMQNVSMLMMLIQEDNIKKFATSSGTLTKVSEDYLDITKDFSEAQKMNIDPNPMLTNFAGSIAKIGESFDKMDVNKVGLYQRFTSITTGLTKINTPFEKFTKLFGQFAKDMNYFVKTWDQFGKGDADNLKSYADSLKVIASVDASKLRETTQALKEQALAQNDLNKANESKSGAGGAGGGILDKVTGAVKEGVNKITGGDDTKQPEPKNNQGVKPGSVVAELHVTNLYLNGKLQS